MSPHPQILPTNERPLAENGNPIFYLHKVSSGNFHWKISPAEFSCDLQEGLH